MKRRLARAAMMVVATVAIGTSAGCWWDWREVPIYARMVPVPYYGPEGYGTAPQVIRCGGSTTPAGVGLRRISGLI